MPFDPLTDPMNDPIFGASPQGAPTAGNPNAAAMAQAGTSISTPFSGAPMPPMLPAPTLSEKLLAAAQGSMAAGSKGGDFGEQLAGALGGYHNAVQQGYADQNTNYNNRINQYMLMGQIRDRQMAEMQMYNRINAVNNLVEKDPANKDWIMSDPEGYMKALHPPMMIVPNGGAVVGGMAAPSGDTAAAGGGSSGVGGNTVPGAPAGLPVQYGGIPTIPVDPASGALMQGQSALDAITRQNPQIGSLTRAFLNYQLPVSATADKDPNMQKAAQLAAQIDDNWSVSQYTQRDATQGDYGSSGKNGQTLTAMGAAANHGASMMKNYDAIKNGASTATNGIANWWDTGKSGPVPAALAGYQTDLNGFAPEMAKIASGTGESSDSGRDQERDPFNQSSASVPSAMRAAVGRIGGKYASMMQTYATDVGKTGPMWNTEQFNPEAKAFYKAQGVDLDAIKAQAFNAAKGTRYTAPMPPRAAGQAPPPNGAAAPAPPPVTQSPLTPPQAAPSPAIPPQNVASGGLGTLPAPTKTKSDDIPGMPGLMKTVPTPSALPPGAKKASDGKWYVKDPSRPGKYMMVQ